jgi:curved DNA-binding protein CbpA
MTTTRRSAGRLPDYYGALGIEHDATFQQIEAAYWKKAFARDELKLLNEALEVLGNASRRAAYDELRLTGNVRTPREWTPRRTRVTDALRERWRFS